MKLFLPLAILLFALSVHSQTAVVISDKADLRGTPSDKGKVIVQIKRDTPLEIIKQNNAWFLVQSVDHVGWVHGSSIKIVSTGGNATVMERVIQTPSSRAVVTVPEVQKTQTTDSRTYIRGPRGGCYYINSSAKKTYVDHSCCRQP